MRTFIAVEIPEEIKGKVGGYIGSIRNLFGNKVKWVEPENLHFTIKFLGEIDKSDLDIVTECVSKTASDFGSFTIGLSGVGFFPTLQNPRVFWIGTDGGGDKLLDVYQELESCLEYHGFDRDAKTFSPHLTIGRVRKDNKLIVPGKIDDFEPVDFEVCGIAVIKSSLTPKGPIYEKLFESSFTGNI